MAFAWFIYTIAIMAVALAACMTSVTVWVLTNRRDCIAAGAGFLAYALDVGAILFDEYIREKPAMGEYFDTGLTHPIVNIALRVAIVTCLWLWMVLRVHAKADRRHIVCFAAGYAVLAALVAPIGNSTGAVRTMLFWGLSDCLIIASFVFAWWWRSYRASETDRISIDRSAGTFKIALAMAILMLLEDVFNILIVDTASVTGLVREFYWHLTERNLMENVLMVFLAVKMMLYNREVMAIFSRHPREDAAKAEQGGSHRDFETRLLRFADDHGMSKREREVLGLAIEGKDTQNIATELFISPGTVKAHMHRIYSKAGVEHRQDLINAFWKY